nr:hypothetical protein GCM10017611_07360 [Rhodococcus wratislaviensis]
MTTASLALALTDATANRNSGAVFADLLVHLRKPVPTRNHSWYHPRTTKLEDIMTKIGTAITASEMVRSATTPRVAGRLAQLGALRHR